jgi:hypothetical protein
MGTIDYVYNLPDNYTQSDDLKQFYVDNTKDYRYWSQPTAATGEWIINKCQKVTGCDGTGWYAFGVGGPNAHWNRLDGELSVDQVLDIDSTNAIANKIVTETFLEKISYTEANETIDWVIDNIFPAPE